MYTISGGSDMLGSIKAFMTGIVDYAGLFPPAKLPLEAAAHDFAEYRKSSHAWMLSRFVCPAAKLFELNELAIADDATSASDNDAHRSWPISVLGSSGDDLTTFLENNLADCKLVQSLMKMADAKLLMDALETKLPSLGQFENQSVSLADVLMQLSQTWLTFAEGQSILQFTVFLELAAEENWQRAVERLASAAALCNRRLVADKHGLRIGLKIRTGGVQASAIPPIDDVATLIFECNRHSVPFKATAGLHHPMRHHSPEVPAKMHGFLNVFGAAALAFANDLSEGDLQAILAEESADQFIFSDEGFRWRDHHASVEQIEAAREQFALSFGSCSFTEPIEDLLKLNLLPTHSKV